MAQKRGKEKGRTWLGNGPWLLVILALVFGLYFIKNRSDHSTVRLKYGELKQILQDPSISFQK